MRKVLVLAGVAGLALLAALSAISPASASDHSGGALTLAVYGDAPYGTNPTDTSEFVATPAFIDSVNADPQVSLVAHVGDIHSGKQHCTQSYDESIASLWTAYQDPLIYTPGDNEWTDCHKAGEGGGTWNATTQQITYVTDPATGQPVDYAGGDPAANLALVRSIFFPNPGEALGGGHMRVLSQAQVYDQAYPSDRKFVENVMFERHDTLFVTLDLPGGSNNDNDIWYGAPSMSSPQSQEIAERTGADLRWLDRAFAQARFDRDQAVVLMVQADMWDIDGKSPAHLTGFEPIVASIASHTQQFAKPVLLINGDSHVYRSDNPLSPTAACTTEAAGGVETSCTSDYFAHPSYDVENFHRIVVHGSTFPLEWLKLTVASDDAPPSGPNAFGPFSWQRMPQASFTPLLADAARFARHSPGDRWFVDETYVKVTGVWRYVYRAVDQDGQVIDILVSVRRDADAARRFFRRALATLTVTPVEVVTDAAAVYPRVLDELVPAAWHHVERWANNRIESDHGRLKHRLRPMRGLRTDRTATVIIAGLAFVQNLRRGHYELAVDLPAPLRIAAAFTELARAI